MVTVLAFYNEITLRHKLDFYYCDFNDAVFDVYDNVNAFLSFCHLHSVNLQTKTEINIEQR